MKRVIITGATGFIGRSLTRELLKKGTEVWAIGRDIKDRFSDLHSESLHVIEASFEDYENLPILINERGFDVFYHFAWAGYGKQTNDIKVQISNILYSAYAAQAAAKLGSSRFVFADSSHEHLVLDSNGNEECFCSIYGAAKHSASRMIRTICNNCGMDFVGVLFTNIFGVGDKSSRSTNTFIRKLMAGKDLDLIKGDKLYDWTYIDDCINGVLAAAECGKSGKIYYVGSQNLRPFYEIITEVRDIINPCSKLNFGAYQDNSFINYKAIDIYDLYRDTGFQAKCNFKESILKTAEWVKKLRWDA